MGATGKAAHPPRGLEQVRHEDTMEILQAEICSPKEADMVMLLHTDSVYTPARAWDSCIFRFPIVSGSVVLFGFRSMGKPLGP